MSPWAARISAGDYERHMTATGQPQANADLVAECFRGDPPAPGASIFIPGAGTGQIFEFLPPDVLARYRVTCTDINPGYLARLARRLPAAITALDDIESPTVEGPFDLAIVILVLEHVEWRRAVAALARITSRVFAIVQENPPGLAPSLLTGTMAALNESPMHMVDSAELIAEFASHRFDLTRRTAREVRDGKRMLAFDFKRRL